MGAKREVMLTAVPPLALDTTGGKKKRKYKLISENKNLSWNKS